jgi:adenylyltransferase/sulfurtransferase
VGSIGIVDFDKVELSNLHRQVLFGHKDLGVNKAKAAQIKLENLNPTIDIKAYPTRLEAQNAIKLIGAYDIVVDATDDITTRYLINDGALLLDKPVVYGALYKFEGQVSVFNYHHGPTYRCLFPAPPAPGSLASCSEIGVLGVLPGVIGCMQANEALKIILKLDGILSGKLLYYNSIKGQTSLLSLPNYSHKRRKQIKEQGFIPDVYGQGCPNEVRSISLEEAFELKNAQFVDVRNASEEPKIDLSNCIQIPMTELAARMDQLNEARPFVFFCASGIRSYTAVQMIQQQMEGEFYNLSAGANALAAFKKEQYE